ncbi:Holliday junction recognition protein isoform X2 [Choloepus didactylus]|uniref:Holliday junction recognition protein isoform X2 n=1 Tax=Choloepus didactylus TaxID=27675 RepID=UPI00189E8608|nr:Holliday junction recognition protein isoform X2 [Choloepus didactylus]
MEAEAREEAVLVAKLRDSRRRFQRRMQQLIEKYNRPFEDAPLVQMATLTYETPQGLRIWGGGWIKEMDTAQIQESLVEPVDRMDGPLQATGKDLQSSDVDATLDLEDPVAGAIKPAVPQSPSRSEIRRKYLAQVDVLRGDGSYLECTENRSGEDTHLTLSPSLASPAEPALGYPGYVSEKGLSRPVESASSLREPEPSHPCSGDLAVVPRNDSLWSPGTSGSSFLSSQSLEAEDLCDVTVSDLYTGMLHSMSRLLSAKPSCTISTKTSIVQTWNSRWRHKWKSRMHKTYCRGSRQSQRSSQKRGLPCAEPAKEVKILRDAGNLLNASSPQTGVEVEKALLEVNKLQIPKSDPSWKVLRVIPQKYSSSTYLDFSTRHHDDQENRLMTLKWLISPVKIVSKPSTHHGHRGNRYREIEIKFDKLHQECCLNPGKQPSLPYLPGSWAVDMYGGGSGDSETHRLSITFPKRINKSLENLGKRSLGGDGFLPKSSSSSPLSKTDAAQSPSHLDLTPDSLFQGSNPGIFRQLLSPSKTFSNPGIQRLGHGRNRYDEIKENFDKLHQKYCRKSPQQTESSFTGQFLNKANAEIQCKKGNFLGKFNLELCLQGPPKLSPLHWSIRSPLGPTPAEVLPFTCVAPAGSRDRQSPAKRRRLSDPLVCRRGASSWNPSGAVGGAIPRPGQEEGCPSRLDWEEKKVRFCFISVAAVGKKKPFFRMEKKMISC